jgi:hypothetical protein
VDAGILLRSLYEHLVHFAWLAADPSDERIGERIKDDLRLRLIADNDARAHGEWLYSDRAAKERQVEAMRGNRLVLADLAPAADKAWQGKLDAVGHTPKTKLFFRGLYAFVYRSYGVAGAHPSHRGLNPVVEDITPTLKRVVLEGPPQGRGPYGLATVIYSLPLYVAAGSIGWPTEDDVEVRLGPTRREPRNVQSGSSCRTRVIGSAGMDTRCARPHRRALPGRARQVCRTTTRLPGEGRSGLARGQSRLSGPRHDKPARPVAQTLAARFVDP